MEIQNALKVKLGEIATGGTGTNESSITGKDVDKYVDISTSLVEYLKCYNNGDVKGTITHGLEVALPIALPGTGSLLSRIPIGKIVDKVAELGKAMGLEPAWNKAREAVSGFRNKLHSIGTEMGNGIKGLITRTFSK